jgi:hypothetical protein
MIGSDLKGLVERLDVGRLCRCGRECSECEYCKDRDKSDRFAESSRYHDLTQDVVSRRTIHAANMAKSSPRPKTPNPGMTIFGSLISTLPKILLLEMPAKDAAAVCRALEAADIQCLGQR